MIQEAFAIAMFWTGVTFWCAFLLIFGFICASSYKPRSKPMPQSEHEADGHIFVLGRDWGKGE